MAARRKKRARSQRPRSRGKGAEPNDRQPYPASVVSETGKGVLLRIAKPEGGEVEIWFPRAAVQPLAGGQWLVSRAALEAKAEAVAEISKADAVFGKDFLPVLGGEIIGQTEKAYRVRVQVSCGSNDPRAWWGYVPITQAKIVGDRLCLSRWIIGQKQDEIATAIANRLALPVPNKGGMFQPAGWGRPEQLDGRPAIEIDQDAIARAIMGPGAAPAQRPTIGPETPAKASTEPGRLF